MRKYFILFSLLIFIMCSDKKNNKPNIENQILLSVGKQADNTQYFKEYFALETIIPIETTNEFLMGDGIRRVLSYKDKLFILDNRSSIFVVGYATGKIDTYIRRIGNGPGESKNIMDISFDEQTETILVLNDYSNLLYFDLKGNFLKQEKINKFYENMIFNDGNILFYNNGKGYSCYPYMIEKYNLQNKTIEIIGKDEKLDVPTRLYGRHIVKSRNIWFGTPYDFELYTYLNSRIISGYKLNPKITHIKKEDMVLASTDYRKFLELKSMGMYGIGAIRETDHYLVFISSKSGFFILNKETNEIHWEDHVNETSLGIRFFNYFSHDGDDNRIMFFVRASEWLHRNKDTSMDNIPMKLKEKIDSFNINEESNPILVFYREKNK